VAKISFSALGFPFSGSLLGILRESCSCLSEITWGYLNQEKLDGSRVLAQAINSTTLQKTPA